MTTANRIVGHATVPAADLTANPRNWRDHPQAQRDALDSALTSVGWVKRVVVNKRTGLILDGHLRVEQAAARGESVPVVYVDLSEREESIVLLTLDPLAEEAGTDTEKLHGLLDTLQGEFADLNGLLDQIASANGIELNPEPPAPKKSSEVTCPRCSATWSE